MLTSIERSEVNLTGTMRVCRAALPRLRQRGGAIVNIASVAAFNSSPESVSYAASKAAVVSYTRSLAFAHQVPAFEKLVPLTSVADIIFGSGPIQIERTDRSRSETVEAELSGLTVGEAERLVANLPSIRQLPAAVVYKPAGDSERMQELFADVRFWSRHALRRPNDCNLGVKRKCRFASSTSPP